ncbi:M43 family zinc metalloprotease [Fulvivirgaceae bacterium BMA10]|uniref:M43 family zinc metalloprotease n=1 Tax=Splendidivirga corallicola TaxID=3051826 RepID=A0ABT8KTW8_9BACT|nr:M43 family zinc metalloprotease [Fulvivirgaceae bacterium BMA10]
MKKLFVLAFLSFLFLTACDEDDHSKDPGPENGAKYEIPVVIHIVHRAGETIGEGSNLSTERIVKQIENLNNDFRRKKGTRGYNEHPDGADAQIEFKLAEIDPLGNRSTGIRRINGDIIEPRNGAGPFDWLPDYGFWDPNKYVNIWVMPQGKTFFGVANPPEGDLPGLDKMVIEVKTGDGILINSLYFGESDDDPNVLGRTLTHEMGHFLGLLHLWGGDPITIWNCEDLDKINDFCDDTPSVTEPTGNCVLQEIIFACDGTTPALRNNYMDYTDDACMNMFTKDQVKRMHWVLENSPRRKSLTSAATIKR